MLVYQSNKQEFNYSLLYSLYCVYQIARFDSSQIHAFGSIVIVYSIFMLMIDHYLWKFGFGYNHKLWNLFFQKALQLVKNIHYLLFYVYHSIGSKILHEKQRNRKDAQHHVSFFHASLSNDFTISNRIYNAEILLQRTHRLSFVVICLLLTSRRRENAPEQNRNSSQIRFIYFLFVSLSYQI